MCIRGVWIINAWNCGGSCAESFQGGTGVSVSENSEAVGEMGALVGRARLLYSACYCSIIPCHLDILLAVGFNTGELRILIRDWQCKRASTGSAHNAYRYAASMFFFKVLKRPAGMPNLHLRGLSMPKTRYAGMFCRFDSSSCVQYISDDLGKNQKLKFPLFTLED